MNKFLKFINFIFFRGTVYILSFISYNSNLFNVLKLKKIIVSGKINIYLNKYKIELIIFLTLICFIILGYIFLRKKIKEAREELIEIKIIKKEEPSNLVMYVGTYLLPMLAAFYKLSFVWMLIYEVFIFVIYCRHVNFHYKILMGFLYNGYYVSLKTEENFLLYSNKPVNEIKKLIDEKTTVKLVRFGDDFYEQDILFL